MATKRSEYNWTAAEHQDPTRPQHAASRRTQYQQVGGPLFWVNFRIANGCVDMLRPFQQHAARSFKCHGAALAGSLRKPTALLLHRRSLRLHFKDCCSSKALSDPNPNRGQFEGSLKRVPKDASAVAVV